MSDTYRPGDIAMVTWDEREEHLAVAIDNGPDCRLTWMSPETHYWTATPHEVGPVLGNVADIAANPWKALLGLLDASYPEEVFPTLTDDPARDTGPRLVSALRMLEIEQARRASRPYVHTEEAPNA